MATNRNDDGLMIIMILDVEDVDEKTYCEHEGHDGIMISMAMVIMMTIIVMIRVYHDNVDVFVEGTSKEVGDMPR